MKSIYLDDSSGLANRLITALNLYAVCLREEVSFRADAIPESENLTRSPMFLAPRPNGQWRPAARLARALSRRNDYVQGALQSCGVLAAGRGERQISRPPRVCVGGGWLFSWSSVARFETEIRSAFSLKQSIAENLKLKSSNYVAVHARRGDYQSWQGGAHFYSWEKYEQFALQLLQLNPGAKLIVASNDTPPNGWLNGIPFELAPANPLHALHVLSQCTGIAGPPSTFSLYAAWTGNCDLQTIQASELSDRRKVTTDLLGNFKTAPT